MVIFTFPAVEGQISPEVTPASQAGSKTVQGRGNEMPDDMRRSMAKKANQQRQERLKRDAEKLLKLSTELKEYVDKSNENVLSLDVIKKAEEIEKLAHSVRTKMRGEDFGVPGTP